MSSPEIEKTETEIVIKFPKHTDLDIKYYNPEVFHSLGFNDVSIHLDTLEPSDNTQNGVLEQQLGGGLLDYEPVPEQPIETLTYPYRYFAYMFRALNPMRTTSNNVVKTETIQSREPAVPLDEPSLSNKPTGLMASIMGISDTIEEKMASSQVQEPVSKEPETETKPAESGGFFSMFLNKKDLTKNATIVEPVKETTILPISPEPIEKKTSIMDSLFPPASPEQPMTENKETENKEPSIMDSLFPPASPEQPITENKETENKEPSIMDSLFPPASPEQPMTENKETENKEPSIMDSLFPPASPEQTMTENKETENKEPSIMDSLFPTQTETIQKEPTEPQEPQIQTQPPTAQTQTKPDAVVSSLPAAEPEPAPVAPLAAIVTPFSAKWVIHIPISANSPEGPINTEDKFNDVLVFSEMEAKNGIYVRGEFVDVLGRNIKIGSVEQLGSGENMRTVKEFIAGKPLLEGTLMQKYSLLFM